MICRKDSVRVFAETLEAVVRLLEDEKDPNYKDLRNGIAIVLEDRVDTEASILLYSSFDDSAKMVLFNKLIEIRISLFH